MRFFGVIVLVLSFWACKPIDNPQSSYMDSKGLQGGNLPFQGDSGCFSKADFWPFLLSNKLTDSLPDRWESFAARDTIAKYYKNKDGGYLILSLAFKEEEPEEYILIEMDSQRRQTDFARFSHGNHPCCLANLSEGLFRMGEFFSVAVCGTGSGYCGTFLYVFKKVSDFEGLNSIPSHYSSAFGSRGGPEVLSSKMELHSDMMLAMYKLQWGPHPKEGDERWDFRNGKTQEFSVVFTFKNGVWQTRDSSFFEGLDLWL